MAPHSDKNIYAKPIVLLIDESTFSCAEDFCVDFITMNRGKLIGKKTAGSSGTPLIINLPGGGIAFVCTKQDFFQDGTEYVGFGINPNVEVNTSIEDIKNNVDPVLCVALKEVLD